MIRWRYILFLAVLVMTQVTCSKDDEEQNNSEYEETTTAPDDDDTEEDSSPPPSRATTARVTRTTSRPLQCFVCSYRRDGSAHCLDPQWHNVTSSYCRSSGDQCFTATETPESGLSVAVRGCKSDCVSSPGIVCCNTDLCNSQSIERPSLRTAAVSAAYKGLPHTILYFVTVLLLLQAVVKVNIV